MISPYLINLSVQITTNMPAPTRMPAPEPACPLLAICRPASAKSELMMPEAQ